jgi:hypothetical protein
MSCSSGISEVFRSFNVFTAVLAGLMTSADEMVGGDETAETEVDEAEEAVVDETARV